MEIHSISIVHFTTIHIEELLNFMVKLKKLRSSLY